MRRFDADPNIISWGSEELVIQYSDLGTRSADGSPKLRRYYPDFIIKKRGKDGKIEVIVIEVKPYAQSVPPERGKKTDKRFLGECKTFATNVSKWKSASRYCASKGWRFIVITEKELNL